MNQKETVNVLQIGEDVTATRATKKERKPISEEIILALVILIGAYGVLALFIIFG